MNAGGENGGRRCEEESGSCVLPACWAGTAMAGRGSCVEHAGALCSLHHTEVRGPARLQDDTMLGFGTAILVHAASGELEDAAGHEASEQLRFSWDLCHQQLMARPMLRVRATARMRRSRNRVGRVFCVAFTKNVTSSRQAGGDAWVRGEMLVDA
jgi:hypothetical protein